PSHPFVGKADCQEWNSNWNHLTDALLKDAKVREMYLRRLRTVMDDFLQPPATPYDHLFIESRIDELVTAMAQDVALDYVKWANPWSWGGEEGYPRDQSFAYAINVLKTDYLAVRRVHLFLTHNVDRVALYKIAGSYSAAIPNAQPAGAAIEFGAYEHNPSSGNQDEEYIELRNPNAYAVDVTGWQLAGGIEHTFLPGTVLVAGGRLYVSASVHAFLGRTASPRGGQGLFVQGDYKGHLSNWGETIRLIDRSGRTVDTLTYVGTPSEQQRALRVTEIMYNPAPGGNYAAQAYEFIELKNIGATTLTLDGAKLTEGVSYTFPQGANTRLAPGVCIVVARDRAAFTARYGSSVRLAVGTFTGNLDNAGEKIKLDDRTGNTILEFKYKDSWRPETDGLGFSLTIKDAASADLDSWDKGSAWQASPEQGGSPGK
ncbi:MAG: lamin tail domain-containing protein, partial [Phycisphaerales bacterium]